MVGVTVTAKVDGFRRCGRAWSIQAATVDETEFNAEEWILLRAEPMLVVTAATTGSSTETNAVFVEMQKADPEQKNQAWWTKGGAPELKELKKRGLNISAKERDVAWQAYQAVKHQGA